MGDNDGNEAIFSFDFDPKVPTKIKGSPSTSARSCADRTDGASEVHPGPDPDFFGDVVRFVSAKLLESRHMVDRERHRLGLWPRQMAARLRSEKCVAESRERSFSVVRGRIVTVIRLARQNMRHLGLIDLVHQLLDLLGAHRCADENAPLQHGAE